MHEINSLLIAIYSFIRHLHRLDFLREIEVDLFSISFFLIFKKVPRYHNEELCKHILNVIYTSRFEDNNLYSSTIKFPLKKNKNTPLKSGALKL